MQPDFNQITSNSLKKYKKEYKLRMTTGVNKQELAAAVSKHFAELPLPAEEDVILDAFVRAIRRQGQERINGANSD